MKRLNHCWSASALLTSALLFQVSCIGPKRISPTDNFNASMTQAVKAAEIAREEAIIAVGKALGRGLPINEEKIREIDSRAKPALDTAKSVLAAFIEGGGSKAPVFAAMAVLNTVIAELVAESVLVSKTIAEVP